MALPLRIAAALLAIALAAAVAPSGAAVQLQMKVVGPIVDVTFTDQPPEGAQGMPCVYDSGSPRGSLICYCVDADWGCEDSSVLRWVCWASVGPTTELQVGLVCVPPRAQ